MLKFNSCSQSFPSVWREAVWWSISIFYFLFSIIVVLQSFWSAMMVVLSLFLRNMSTMSKHGVLLYGVTYWKFCGKCTWKRLKLIDYFFWKNNYGRRNTSGRTERRSERSCLETCLWSQNSDLSRSDLSSSRMTMLSWSKVMSYQKDHTVLSGYILMMVWLISSSRH